MSGVVFADIEAAAERLAGQAVVTPLIESPALNERLGLRVLDALQAAQVLRADHLIHVRCELPAPNARELFQP